MHNFDFKHPLFLFGLLITLFFCTALSYGHNLTATQQSLKQLNQKITVLQTDLSQTHHKENQLKQELAATDRLIQDNEKKLHAIQQKIPAKKTDIERIEQKITDLQQKFNHLQSLLAQQIQARYKQQPNQPLAWLFINTQKADMDKLLTYYQYIIHANAHTLQALKTTGTDLEHQQQEVHQDIQAIHQMEAQAQIAHQQLQTHKDLHQRLLYALQQQVATQEKTLSSYERNRDNLSQILHKLSQESVIQTRHSMTTMKRKLPTPIAVETHQIQKLHQGIILYSPEGSPVHAVYPGKVVFCEWLNGYGLLLIIDHGWGLMTLYANNLTLTKQVGDMVNQGEQIATVGHSGISKQSGLYFEVRKQGKAISPLEWLKKGNYHV